MADIPVYIRQYKIPIFQFQTSTRNNWEERILAAYPIQKCPHSYEAAPRNVVGDKNSNYIVDKFMHFKACRFIPNFSRITLHLLTFAYKNRVYFPTVQLHSWTEFSPWIISLPDKARIKWKQVNKRRVWLRTTVDALSLTFWFCICQIRNWIV